MNTVESTNYARVCGVVTQAPVFNHEILGENFYNMTVEVERLSGSVDYIPVEVSDRIVNIEDLREGVAVQVMGSFRSYNKKVQDEASEQVSSRLILNLFADTITEVPEGEENANGIVLDGYICKEPRYRATPRGREICDILLAVNRAYGKSDYIPCISWGRNASFAGKLPVGTHVHCEGRIQSRVYLKDGDERVAYEISLTSIRTEM